MVNVAKSVVHLTHPDSPALALCGGVYVLSAVRRIPLTHRHIVDSSVHHRVCMNCNKAYYKRYIQRGVKS